jgi:hypothetical protein
MQKAGFFLSSHSQILTNEQLCFLTMRCTRRSRLRFLANFAIQYEVFVLGRCPQCGHPCQKQPCTNTATRGLRKKKSGEPSSLGKCSFHPLIPSRTRNDLRRRSVVTLPCERIAAMFRLRHSVGTLNRGSLSCGIGSKECFFEGLPWNT